MKKQKVLAGEILAFFSNLEVEYCASLVNAMQHSMGIQFADSSYVSLVIHLAMQIYYKQHGIVSVEGFHEQDKRELDVALVIAKKIEERYCLKLSDDERAFLSAQIQAAKSSHSMRDIIGEGADATRSQEVNEVVSEILNIASEYLHPYLKIDRELERSLKYHLEPTLEQLRLGMSIRNPLLEDMKKSYPFVFEVARQASEVISSRIQKPVPDDEIGYLAMHLAAAMERMRPFPGPRQKVIVVCGEGIATAWMLVSRLRVEFPNIIVSEVMSAQEVQRLAHIERDIDAIITTLSLERKDVPMIVVNPLLRVNDLVAIRQVLGASAAIAFDDRFVSRIEGMPSLVNLLKVDTIALKVDCADWTGVVDVAIGLLIQTGGVEHAFAQTIKELIVERGTYMIIWPKVALLHGPPRAGVKRLCMSLVTLSHPVQFGNSADDAVDVVFSMGAPEGFAHHQALHELIDLMNDTEALQIIRNATDKDQVYKALLRITGTRINA
jgi:mannitol/fructose-specific phosphotransferase system IIA component (Ntr-type)/galactitol-specific phosphotransferase system IIB component